jgi:hypothetical protein
MAADNRDLIDPAEDCPWRSPREIFARLGFSPVPPFDLDGRQLPGRLWELLYAAAARRFFFSHTNHLSDRELYVLLWNRWLDEPTADIPLEAETNTNIIISEFNAKGMNHEEIWLRFYADESVRKTLKSSDAGLDLPPQQDPAYDRDRFLPVAPVPMEAHAGWLPGDDDPGQISENVSADFDGIEHENASARDDATLDIPEFGQPGSALEAELEAMEPENWVPPAEDLTKENVPLLPPAEITDEALASILWELLHNLALRGFYILHTDHLSDREVYVDLWHHGLREPAHLPGRNLRGGWFHDFLGSWGEEETQLWLRYYASEQERAKHAAEWPKDPIPPKEKPRFNRDWRLPKGPI